MSELEISKLKPILIKVSCDGTNLSRSVKVVNLVFNVINEKIKAATASGCYRIGIFKINVEDYESTKEWLPHIWNIIKSFTHMYYDKIDRKAFSTEVALPSSFSTTTASILSDTERYIKINIDHCFCSDYKMDLLVLGMYGASGNWPCIYCTQHKDNLHIKGILLLTYTNIFCKI